jgi:hypothetical protein
MCAEKGTVVVLCVCYQADCRILGLYFENKVPLGFSWQFQFMICVDFVENALFKSWPPLPSSLLDELSIDEKDSDRFLSRFVVCRSTSDSSCNSTDSIITVHCRLSTTCTLLDYTFYVCTTILSMCVLDLLIWHACATITKLRAIEFLWLSFSRLVVAAACTVLMRL